MAEVDNFISSVKEKRDEAVEYFLSEDFQQGLANGVETPEVVIQRGVDKLVGSILDVVEEHHSDFITAETDSGDEAIISCVSDLSTLYFEEVSN